MEREIEALFIAARVFDRTRGRPIRNPKSSGTISREGVESERNGDDKWNSEFSKKNSESTLRRCLDDNSFSFFSSSFFYNRFKYRYRRENTIEREERWKGKYFSSLNFALALLLHRREDDRRGKIGKKSDGLIEWSRLMNIVF